MARITDDGKIKAPPGGMAGFHIAWQDFGAWLGGELPDQHKRLVMVRKGNPGGGGGNHSNEWDRGYAIAAHNALVRLRHAFGINTNATEKPRPDKGTDARHGYDAGSAAVQLVIGRL